MVIPLCILLDRLGFACVNFSLLLVLEGSLNPFHAVRFPEVRGFLYYMKGPEAPNNLPFCFSFYLESNKHRYLSLGRKGQLQVYFWFSLTLTVQAFRSHLNVGRDSFIGIPLVWDLISSSCPLSSEVKPKSWIDKSSQLILILKLVQNL